jgi:hypothetical protein
MSSVSPTELRKQRTLHLHPPALVVVGHPVGVAPVALVPAPARVAPVLAPEAVGEKPF